MKTRGTFFSGTGYFVAKVEKKFQKYSENL